MPRGRPPQKKVTIGRDERRSPFNPKMHGIEKDPKQDYRWVDKKRIEERQEMDGYEFVKPVKENTSDGRVKAKGMTLMSRKRELAEESARRKELKTRQRTQSYKESFGDQVEKLSKKYDMDLHKSVKDYE